jgi:DNA-binding NarL/FixJ family response regulator
MASDQADSATRVLILYRDVLAAQAVQSALERTGLIVQVADVTADPASRQHHSGGEPDVVVVELSRANAGALEGGRTILTEYPDAKVLALTASEDIDSLLAAARAGFHGCVTMDASIADLLGSIQAARRGHVMRPDRSAARAAGRRTGDDRDAALLASQLTPRELDVLCLLADGERGDSIARILKVSPHTARTHIQNILTKLQVHSRLEAVAFALRYGVVASRLVSDLQGEAYDGLT